MADTAYVIAENKDQSMIYTDEPMQSASSTEFGTSLFFPHYCLPTEKIYDVFFWHRPKDRDWVEELAKRLESPEYGLTCCFLQIDADLVDSVTDDVRRCVESSRKTIGVLSQDHLKRFKRKPGTTWYTDHDPSQRLLARIMFDQDTCPEYIEILHHEQEGSELFWKQLKAVIMMNHDFVNNEKIGEVPLYIGSNCIPQPTPEIIPKELCFRWSQLDLSFDTYQEIIKIVMKAPFASLRRHNEYMMVGLVTMLVFSFQFACLAIWFFVESDNARRHAEQETYSERKINHNQTNFLDDFALFLKIVLCLFFMTFCFMVYEEFLERKVRLSLIDTLAQANRIAMEHDLMVAVKQHYGYKQRKEDKFTIVFRYFIWWPCLDNLERSVPDFNKRLPLEDPKEMLSKYGACYAMLLLERKTRSAVKRHCSNGQCVCQCIESRLPISCALKILTLERKEEYHFLGRRYFLDINRHRRKGLPWFFQSNHKHPTTKRLVVILAVYLAITFFIFIFSIASCHS